MLRTVRLVALLACVGLAPSAAWAQATFAGTVKDASGAVLPGVTVEASSPALIEKSRTAMTDGTGQYRIESLQPGTYTVTFTLAGFSTLKRDDVVLSGTGVITIDADLKVGGVAETVTVTGETPVVDVQSTKREVTLDNETMRNLPSVRSYSYLLTAVPGVQPNINNVNTGPVFAIFPIHGGRGVESRLTVDGLNISNPPGRQPAAELHGRHRQRGGSDDDHVGRPRRIRDRRRQMNIVPKQGGNRMSRPGRSPPASRKGMQSNNYTDELQARGADAAEPGVPRLRRQRRGRRPDREGQALVLHERPRAGIAPEHPERLLQPERGRPERVDLRRRISTSRRTRIARGRTTRRASRGRRSQKNKFSFSWDEQPVCRKCTGTTSFSGSPSPTDVAGSGRPRRVQPAARPDRCAGRRR